MKIVGQLVCGPGEADKYLRETLEEFKRICDETMVCLSNATSAEKDMVEEYGFFHYEDNREWGRHQPDIKTELLKRIMESCEPDYVLVLDADETVPTLTREILETYVSTHESMQLYIVNLWNDAGHYRKSMGFWNVRAYNPNASPDRQFLKKPVHCGNAPPYFYSQSAKATYVPHILLHKGLMDPEVRARKVARYKEYDPHAQYKGYEYYEALEVDTPPAEYVQEDVLRKITDYCNQIGAYVG